MERVATCRKCGESPRSRHPNTCALLFLRAWFKDSSYVQRNIHGQGWSPASIVHKNRTGAGRLLRL